MVVGTVSNSSNIIWHPNYLLSCLPRRNFVSQPSGLSCAVPGSSSALAKACQRANSLLQEKAFLDNLLSHSKEMDP